VEAEPLIDLKKGSGLFSFSDNRHERPSFQFRQKKIETHTTEAFKSPSGLTRLKNNHTGEEIFLSSNLSLLKSEKINWFFRDWREKKSVAMDQSVIMALNNICRDPRLHDLPEFVYIHSGYRTRATNEMLRKRSSSVAKNSLHIQGKAIDFSIPGVSPRLIASIAREILDGGVGQYDNFVHIDTGPKREWIG
jgi:uncharacterized protein YcbK (DUF882 family)